MVMGTVRGVASRRRAWYNNAMSDAHAIPDGQIAAFFDADHTILSKSSGALYIRHLTQTGQVGRKALLYMAWWGFLYKLTLVDFSRIMIRLAHLTAGEAEAEARADCDRWFANMVAPCVTEEARRRIAEHQEGGHRVVIVSAATVYVVRPLAEYLGVADYLCTYLEVEDGRFTGRLVEPACYGWGKLLCAEAFTADHGIDLRASYFYSDSFSDRPLLERVGHPVAVNPDPRLRRYAARRGWPIERFY